MKRDRAIEKSFNDLAKLGGQLTYYRLPTEQERDLTPGVRFVPVSLGRMDGLNILGADHVEGSLRDRVIGHLETLEVKAMLALKGEALDRYSKFIGDMKGTLRQGGYYLVDAGRFVRGENWEAFARFCRESGVQMGPQGE
ncbi:hypothetical protein [Variovorax sp. GT1P44]|uniref:hypothetical protein n=1 Tax=Variovorax sp. GT1P44 TaxID=3443742 RepID=UPI003F4903B4